MSLATMFSKNDPTIAGLTFDCVISESMEATYDSTDYSVESGAVYQDHIRPKPKIITLRVAMTDTPFAGFAESLVNTGISYGASYLPSAVTGAIGTGTDIWDAAYGSDALTRSAQSWVNLLKVAEGKDAQRPIVFDVLTTKGLQTNYHIQSMSYETNETNEQSIEIVVELKQILTKSTLLPGGQPTKDQLRIDSTEMTQCQPPVSLGDLTSELF